MNPEKLLSRHALANGLFLEFWDRSRPVAGDRWQVAIVVRVPVAVTADSLPPELRAQSDRVISVLGENVVFAKEEVRQFIAATEMPGLLKLIEEQLLSSLRGYLGHPDFAARFIRKKYAEYREKQRLVISNQ